MSRSNNEVFDGRIPQPAPLAMGVSERVSAVPFADVWRAALAAARSVEGWSISAQDARTGRIQLRSETRLWKTSAAVDIRLWLDESGMTRIRTTVALREGRFDLGIHARRAARFLDRLDLAVLKRR